MIKPTDTSWINQNTTEPEQIYRRKEDRCLMNERYVVMYIYVFSVAIATV